MNIKGMIPHVSARLKANKANRILLNECTGDIKGI
uniref:Uncharacterized protein n=1 Tax=Arundo donax TaxID=35708 RepID=A0A0A8ZPH9_ARUDO